MKTVTTTIALSGKKPYLQPETGIIMVPCGSNMMDDWSNPQGKENGGTVDEDDELSKDHSFGEGGVSDFIWDD